MTDLEKVKLMEDMNWKPAAQYWKEQYEKAKAANQIKGDLELQYDMDGIWLVYVGHRHAKYPHRGHIPWQTIAVYIKEYLKE